MCVPPKTPSFLSRKHTLQYVQYIRYKAQQDNAYLCLEIVHFGQRMDVLHIALHCYSSSSLKDKWASLLEVSALSIGSTGIGQNGSEQSFLQKRTVPSCRSGVPSFSTINVCDFAYIVKNAKFLHYTVASLIFRGQLGQPLSFQSLYHILPIEDDQKVFIHCYRVAQYVTVKNQFAGKSMSTTSSI